MDRSAARKARGIAAATVKLLPFVKITPTLPEARCFRAGCRRPAGSGGGPRGNQCVVGPTFGATCRFRVTNLGFLIVVFFRNNGYLERLDLAPCRSWPTSRMFPRGVAELLDGQFCGGLRGHATAGRTGLRGGSSLL